MPDTNQTMFAGEDIHFSYMLQKYTNNILTLSLSPGFSVDSGDEITITGKFIDIV